jgi:flagellar protein FlgJ
MQTLPVYTDFQSLAAMHGVQGAGEAKRLEDVAGQFASVFTHMMLKSMRQASLGDGLLDSQQSLFYRDMFDQQLALTLSSGDGFGIKQVLAEQLRTVTGIKAPEQPADATAADGAASASPGSAVKRAQDAYLTVQEMTRPQESGDPADTGYSRNILQLDPRD